jgi:hypothetical protein
LLSTPICSVLGRTRRGNDGRVADGAAGHLHATRGKALVDPLEQRVAQLVLLQQAAEES